MTQRYPDTLFSDGTHGFVLPSGATVSGHVIARGELFADLAPQRAKLALAWGPFQSGIWDDDAEFNVTILRGPVLIGPDNPFSMGLAPQTPGDGDFFLHVEPGTVEWRPVLRGVTEQANVNVPAQSTAFQDFAVPGLTSSHRIILNVNTALPVGIVIAGAWNLPGGDTVRAFFGNLTATPVQATGFSLSYWAAPP